MQRILLLVGGRAAQLSGDTFEVFGNGGGGPVDFSAALSDRPMAYWPGAGRRFGHLRDAHLAARHADGVFPDGHVEGLHLLDAHGRPSAPIAFETPEYVFGAFVHAVRAVDALGNAADAEVLTQATTINSAPAKPWRFAKSGFDYGTGQVVFEFERL